jgi:hypothetical protein
MSTTVRVVGILALAVLVLLGLSIVLKLPWLPRVGQSVAAMTKGWYAPAPKATLLVITDLDCDWILDGKIQGRIQAKGTSTLPVAPGQHLVEARTLDGKDYWRAAVELHASEQYVTAIGLEAIRQMRLADEKALEDKRIADARQPAPEVRRKEEEHPQQQPAPEDERERKAAEAIGGWVDPATHLMWALSVHIANSWGDASDFCAGYRAGAHSDWRLPSIEELESLNRARTGGGRTRQPPLPFGILLDVWSATEAPGADLVWTFSFSSQSRRSERMDMYVFERTALCVRSSGGR